MPLLEEPPSLPVGEVALLQAGGAHIGGNRPWVTRRESRGAWPRWSRWKTLSGKQKAV